MPSPFFSRLLRTVASYVGDETANGVLTRRLKHSAATPDTFGPPDLAQMLLPLSAALELYLTDNGKKTDLRNRLHALVG